MRRIFTNIIIGLLFVLQIWSVANAAEVKNDRDQWELVANEATYEMHLKPISIWPPDNTVTVNSRLIYKDDSSVKGFLAKTVFDCSNNKVRTTYSIEKKDGSFTSRIEDWQTVKEKDIFGSFYESGCAQILQKAPSTIIKKKVNLIEEYRALSVYRLESYNFNPNAPIISRIKTVPDFLISHLHVKDLRENYLSHMPNKKELEIIENAIDKLPPLNQKVLKDRVVGIYFIKNFWGSGLADFVLDESGKLYVYLVFDAEILTKNMDEWLTNKDKTCFYNDDNTKIEIVVDNKLDAFLGVLLHESTHAVDYVAGVTPYMDEGIKKLKGESIKSNDLVNDVWKGFDVPLLVNAYKLRGDISFYGFEGPKIPISKAEVLYKGFSETAFPSIYGSKSWGEDIAELITFFHLTQKMNRPYVIRVLKNNKLIYSYEPMNSEKVKARFNKIQGFYN